MSTSLMSTLQSAWAGLEFVKLSNLIVEFSSLLPRSEYGYAS